jgi:hypothetical protein
MVFNWWISYFHKKSFEHLKDLFNYENSYIYFYNFYYLSLAKQMENPKSFKTKLLCSKSHLLKTFLIKYK